MKNMSSNKIKAYIFPLLSALLGMASILICYTLAQLYNHQKPFPNSTITATANHYPQYIIFRLGTISGSVLAVVSHFINYFWIKTVAAENSFPLSSYRPHVSLILGTFGSVFLMGNTATINTGQENAQWHIVCAISTFAFSIFAQIYNSTVVLMLSMRNFKGISKNSAYLKFALAILTLIQMIIGIDAQLDSHLSNFIQYALAFSLYSSLLLMAYDVKDFKLIFVKSK